MATRERATADDLEWAVQYALMQGCFFPVPEPKGYSTTTWKRWGAMRHLHDVIARYPFKRDFSHRGKGAALPAVERET